MGIVNIIIDTLGILVLIVGITFGLKFISVIALNYLKGIRAKKQTKKTNIQELEERIKNLEGRIPSSRKLNQRIRFEVREYLKQLSK